MSELGEKVKRAIRIIRMADAPLEVSYSGGKDSDVILALAKQSGVDFRAIYKNTTIDPPGTIQHAIQGGGRGN